MGVGLSISHLVSHILLSALYFLRASHVFVVLDFLAMMCFTPYVSRLPPGVSCVTPYVSRPVLRPVLRPVCHVSRGVPNALCATPSVPHADGLSVGRKELQ